MIIPRTLLRPGIPGIAVLIAAAIPVPLLLAEPVAAAQVRFVIGRPAVAIDDDTPTDPPKDDPKDPVQVVAEAKDGLRAIVMGLGEMAKNAAQLARGPEPDDPEVAQFRQQFEVQLKPILRAERSLIHVLGRDGVLPAEAEAKLDERAKAVAKGVAEEWANHQWKQMRAVAQIKEMRPPATLLRERLATLIADEAPPTLAERYRAEKAEQAETRRRLLIDNLMIRLDEDLVLRNEQHCAIREVVAASWQEGWESNIEYIVRFGQNLIPDLPDEKIVPLLTENQKELWNTLQQQAGFHFFFDGGFGGLIEEEEDGEMVVNFVGNVMIQAEAVEIRAENVVIRAEAQPDPPAVEAPRP